jgi:hypothetical protein
MKRVHSHTFKKVSKNTKLFDTKQAYLKSQKIQFGVLFMSPSLLSIGYWAIPTSPHQFLAILCLDLFEFFILSKCMFQANLIERGHNILEHVTIHPL